ncbi:type I-E CRISPR-associated protein Cse1/CasA [Streptomyces sp. NPDC053493]|uniref:type I-E CRISPR-associated protein Cse1/CasA n=1 Tax=Streptomyces sp. NPDC053493 TaxID=3365705 RepID=UPI0037D2F4B7
MPDGVFNLIDEPWIPVRWRPETQSAQREELPDHVGLRDVLLRAAEISGLAVSEPPAHSALLRILYALTARVTGLDEAGPGDWTDQRIDVLEEGHFPAGRVEEYLTRWRGRFFLYDPAGGRPWMQDARLADQCDPGNTAGVNKLVVTRPAGNNHAWFRHGHDAAPDLPTSAQATLNLLAWHYYGPSGRCSVRDVGGEKTASVTAGPLRTALSYHPEGENLFETLLAGLVRPARTVRRQDDLCPWERDDLPDPAAPPQLPCGPCSRLTACSQHALLLVPDHDGKHTLDAYITWAYRAGRIERDDPFLIWQISQQNNRYPRPADASRSLWRDLDALLLLKPSGTTQAKRPEIIDSALEISPHLRIRALGFDQDGQAKDTQFVDAVTPPVFDLVERDAAATAPAVGRLRHLGEIFGWRLQRAVTRAWTDYVRDPKADADTWIADATARYWPRAEAEFWRRFRQLDRTGTLPGAGLDTAEARKAFLRLAEEAFETVTDNATRTQRGAKAVSQARIELYGGAPKKQPTT